MSAECDKCGSDLSYGEDWPAMYCEPCSLRARIAELEAALYSVRRRRDRINDALGYEFIGEYIDPVLRKGSV